MYKRNQHGFKPDLITSTAGLAIQSALSRALDQEHFALTANLDVSVSAVVFSAPSKAVYLTIFPNYISSHLRPFSVGDTPSPLESSL